jgi:hypothetical protein
MRVEVIVSAAFDAAFGETVIPCMYGTTYAYSRHQWAACPPDWLTGDVKDNTSSTQQLRTGRAGSFHCNGRSQNCIRPTYENILNEQATPTVMNIHEPANHDDVVCEINPTAVQPWIAHCASHLVEPEVFFHGGLGVAEGSFVEQQSLIDPRGATQLGELLFLARVGGLL